MELVEGETLAQRLMKGPLPVDEALEVCRQIAEGVEAAHEKGVIHRDLKPANIKITPEGKVKILDFGLAKAFQEEAATADLSQSPTLTAAMTRAGVILGTAAYMSPEQARGKSLDHRADIWAFGVVMFEMLTGKACFEGETVTDVLAAVMRAEPDWTKLPAAVPDRLRSLLLRCLAKDRGQRLQAIGDARIELEEIAAAGPEQETAARASGTGIDGGVPARRARRATLIAAVSLLALAGGTVVVLSGLWPPPTVLERPLRVSIVHTEGYEVGMPAISPDGTRVAYRARGADGVPRIWVRPLGSSAPQPLQGTEDGRFPFWSPDSHRLGFNAAGGGLYIISADGGPVQRLTDWGWGGAWARDDTIILGLMGILKRISSKGGPVTDVTLLQGQDWEHYSPSFLPDGRHFLFTARQWGIGSESSKQGIYLGSLDSKEIRQLLPDLSSAVYAPPGYIVFARGEKLMAMPFDPVSRELRAEQPFPLGESVVVQRVNGLAHISASADGVLAVRLPPAQLQGALSELRLVNRDGTVMRRIEGTQDYTYSMALEPPDGRRAIANFTNPRSGIQSLYLVDTITSTQVPLDTIKEYTGSPVWSPDGRRVAYGRQPEGTRDDVYIKDLGASEITRRIQTVKTWEHPSAWSRDNEWLLVCRNSGGEQHLCAYSFQSQKLEPFVEVPGASVTNGVFSPDTRFVAYDSKESGRYEVYVTTFPQRTGTWQLTNGGAWILSWGGADGREILVATLSGHIAAYRVNAAGGTFRADPEPAILIRDVGYDAQYVCATPDHSRLLVRVNPDADKDRHEIRLLFGWADALRGK